MNTAEFGQRLHGGHENDIVPKEEKKLLLACKKKIVKPGELYFGQQKITIKILWNGFLVFVQKLIYGMHIVMK